MGESSQSFLIQQMPEPTSSAGFMEVRIK